LSTQKYFIKSHVDLSFAHVNQHLSVVRFCDVAVSAMQHYLIMPDFKLFELILLHFIF